MENGAAHSWVEPFQPTTFNVTQDRARETCT